MVFIVLFCLVREVFVRYLIFRGLVLFKEFDGFLVFFGVFLR